MFLRRPPLPVNDLVVLQSLRPLLPILLLIRSITRSAAQHVQLGVTDLLQQRARPPRYHHRFERDKNLAKIAYIPFLYCAYDPHQPDGSLIQQPAPLTH